MNDTTKKRVVNTETFRHPGWIRRVMESYPKVHLSPQREIVGLAPSAHDRVLKRHDRTFRKLAK